MEQENKVILLANGYKMQNDTLIIPPYVKILNEEVIRIAMENKLTAISFCEGSELEVVENCFNQIKDTIKVADFSNCKQLKELKDKAFHSCWQLKEINFAGCENLTTLGKNLIYNCNALKKIDFSNCTKIRAIPQNCFEHSISLNEINFSNCGLETIEPHAFKDLYDLDNITLLNCEHLINIGAEAFKNCNLRKLDLSTCTNLESIGEHAFSTCESLKDVNLSNCAKLRTIENAFKKLNSLNVASCTELRFGTIDIKRNLIINSRLKNNEFNTFDDIIEEECEVCLQDKNCKYYGSSADFKRMRVGGMHLLAGLNFKTHSEISEPQNATIINCCHNTNELKTAYFNKQNLARLLNLVHDVRRGNYLCYASTICDFLKTLGYFGFEEESFGNVNKNDIISYKTMLAKDLIKHKLSPVSINETNKEFATKLIKSKIEKLAKKPLQPLIESFVRNNLLNFDAKDYDEGRMKNDKFLSELQKVKQQEIKNIKLAQFFVYNIDEIKNTIISVDRNNLTNETFEKTSDNLMTLSQIMNNFDLIYSKSNKLISTRQNNQRLTINDFKYGANYKNVGEDNEELAQLCGRCLLTQSAFEKAQKWFDIGKEVQSKQVLIVEKDDSESEIKYEFIDKNNPVSVTLGYVTNCCQKFDENAESCVFSGMTKENSGFVTLNHNGNIIAQGWVWYNEKTKTVAIDNIEVPLINYRLVNDIKKSEVSDCIFRLCTNFYKTMNNSGHCVENVIIGKNRNDVRFLNEDYKCNERNNNAKFAHPFDFDVYSDIDKNGQFVVIEDNKLCTKNKTLVSNIANFCEQATKDNSEQTK